MDSSAALHPGKLIFRKVPGRSEVSPPNITALKFLHFERTGVGQVAFGQPCPTHGFTNDRIPGLGELGLEFRRAVTFDGTPVELVSIGDIEPLQSGAGEP